MYYTEDDIRERLLEAIAEVRHNEDCVGKRERLSDVLSGESYEGGRLEAIELAIRKVSYVLVAMMTLRIAHSDTDAEAIVDILYSAQIV